MIHQNEHEDDSDAVHKHKPSWLRLISYFTETKVDYDFAILNEQKCLNEKTRYELLLVKEDMAS